jgi:hypothetical protein
VRENRDQTQKEMAQLWGDEASQQNISYGKKLGITRKKKPMAIQKEMKKKEYNFEKSYKKLPITGKFM